MLYFIYSMFHIFDHVINDAQCKDIIKLAPIISSIKTPMPVNNDWSDRVINITNHPIINSIEVYLNQKLNLKLKAYQVQLQVWPIYSYSPLHIHNAEGSRGGSKYTSMLYLNNNFNGGEFLTSDIMVKPIPGRLTFFDGSEIYHGVNKVIGNPRFTLIFWW